MHATTFLCMTTVLCLQVSAYSLHSKFIGHDFYNSWQWGTENDQTHGRVNYIDIPTAFARNLTSATDTSFIMRVDSTSIVPPEARGRDSIRITSFPSYDESVIVIDLQHMPHGCGTWPAFWTVSAAGHWPQGGEIDIIEGVHENDHNAVSLHTAAGCQMEQNRSQGAAYTISTNCDANLNYNQGCGSFLTSPNTYGANFNAAGGGYYVLQRSAAQGINVWFWPRGDPSIPQEILYCAANLVPTSSWGMPDASFPTTMCDYKTYFDAHNMVFDTTFCGDWAGSSFATANCGPGSCQDFVDNNPKAFVEAYWEVNAIRVYT